MADEDLPEPVASLSAAEALAVDIDADGDGEVTMDEFSVFAERFLNTPRDPAGPLDPQQVRGPTPAHTRCLVFGWRAAWLKCDVCRDNVRSTDRCADGGFLRMPLLEAFSFSDVVTLRTA